MTWGASTHYKLTLSLLISYDIVYAAYNNDTTGSQAEISEREANEYEGVVWGSKGGQMPLPLNEAMYNIFPTNNTLPLSTD